MDFAPKATFAKSAQAEPWAAFASSDVFRNAAGAAMLQMQANQGYSTTQTQAMANAYQLEGARTFLSILMNLTTPPSEAPARPRSENLNHSV